MASTLDVVCSHRNSRRYSVDNRSIVRFIKPSYAGASINALHAGLGVGFVPELVVARDPASGKLISLLEPLTTSRLGVDLVYPHRQHPSGKGRAVVDFAARWYTPLSPRLQPLQKGPSTAV